MTIQEITTKYTAGNPTNNVTIPQAQAWADAMKDLGLAFDGVQAMTAGSTAQGDVIQLSALVAMSFPNNVPLNFEGFVMTPGPVDADGTKGESYQRNFNIGLQRLGSATGGYVFLYCERHGPGTTSEQAYDAAISLPLTQDHIAAILRGRISSALAVV